MSYNELADDMVYTQTVFGEAAEFLRSGASEHAVFMYRSDFEGMGLEIPEGYCVEAVFRLAPDPRE